MTSFALKTAASEGKEYTYAVACEVTGEKADPA